MLKKKIQYWDDEIADRYKRKEKIVKKNNPEYSVKKRKIVRKKDSVAGVEL